MEGQRVSRPAAPARHGDLRRRDLRRRNLGLFNRRVPRLVGLLCLPLVACQAAAEESTTYERGADGVTYRVTRNLVDRVVPQTQIETREEKTFQPQMTTRYQPTQQTYLTPVTQYRWVSRMKGRWNPFSKPYWTHQLEPFTHWESKQTTVQTPVTSTEWVEQRRVVQVPVTTYKKVKEEFTSRVAMDGIAAPPSTVEPRSLSPDGRATSIASRPLSNIGGQRLQSDPPRGGRYR